MDNGFNPNRSLGLAWILLFRRVDFVWLLMSNSELLRIKNKQKTPYKKQKTASSYYNYTLNGLMTDWGLKRNGHQDIQCSIFIPNELKSLGYRKRCDSQASLLIVLKKSMYVVD